MYVQVCAKVCVCVCFLFIYMYVCSYLLIHSCTYASAYYSMCIFKLISFISCQKPKKPKSYTHLDTLKSCKLPNSKPEVPHSARPHRILCKLSKNPKKIRHKIPQSFRRTQNDCPQKKAAAQRLLVAGAAPAQPDSSGHQDREGSPNLSRFMVVGSFCWVGLCEFLYLKSIFLPVIFSGIKPACSTCFSRSWALWVLMDLQVC